MFKRISFLLYGTFCYVGFLGVFLYAIGFIGNFGVPTTLDVFDQSLRLVWHAHLLFSIATTAYILVAIQLEERDLVREHGNAYEEYRQAVPMLVPSLRKRDAAAIKASEPLT